VVAPPPLLARSGETALGDKILEHPARTGNDMPDESSRKWLGVEYDVMQERRAVVGSLSAKK